MNSDVQIAGDPLAIPHLLPPVPAHPATVAGFAGLARSIAADRAAWAPLVRYDATTRWYHRLRTVPQALDAARAGGAPIGYEVWLLSWVPGQGSGRHDHGASSGVLTVLEGELTEHAEDGPRTLTAGAQRVFAPGYVHEVVNDALTPAVSLHVYFPGLTNMPMHPSQAADSGAVTTSPGILAP
ncbi:cysteine dioxygenase family protein [Streptomyces sp. Je 1-4]|uniref:cysteine dioxygenase n=1 Tax=Streptomyces TaxID=1883 RepID=UPI0021D8C6B8|nr:MULTISPECIES: cysteine dioxygenase family protein [unclassified Streptomyces]UYB42104.1 cysteine dioxygenase family protein [Streptomyces sp. Je 1-4]UZQ38385.1 cysteine dioxygenase family protein [Streptomyces sp. Je 1-4] [Streptomyces sp. Je 1-4 4N24]UZQ45802.1 cysteine dioxygenase family protein [Streptomyces sp. Je 1-4] [Streptomyces sp. Je 1-4 4N24_ara]